LGTIWEQMPLQLFDRLPLCSWNHVGIDWKCDPRICMPELSLCDRPPDCIPRLGPQFFGDLFVGFSVPLPLGGPLFHFNLTGNRRRIATDDPRLQDRVADNLDFNDLTESESLLIGRDFGVITDIKTGPNGNLFIISLDKGAIYEIYRAH
jgi:hypothetical protein